MSVLPHLRSSLDHQRGARGIPVLPLQSWMQECAGKLRVNMLPELQPQTLRCVVYLCRLCMMHEAQGSESVYAQGWDLLAHFHLPPQKKVV